MEVHHHSHSSRRKWSHYFWEFLMLFLAVFCGFLAEYQLEHVIEHKREKQFMQSLVEDLKLDTAELTQSGIFRQNKLLALDSMITFLSTQNKTAIPFSIYLLSKRYYGGRNFFQNSGTIQQLKNSGGMRLLRKRIVVDSIEAYDQQVRRMEKRDDFENEAFVYNKHLGERFFDTKPVILSLLHNSVSAADDSKMIRLKTDYLNEYLNNLLAYHTLIKANVLVFEKNKQKAINLIHLIKKEYRLK